MDPWWLKDQQQQQFKMEPRDSTDITQASDGNPTRRTSQTSVIAGNHHGGIPAPNYQQQQHHQLQQRSLLHNTDNDEPHHRSRANTWPVNQLEKEPDHGDRSTLPTLPEEEHDGGGGDGSAGGSGGSSTENLSQTLQSVGSGGGGAGDKDMDSGLAGGAKKKNSARRNPWGNMSYADLIERSIESAPDKRLTLSQIYDWLIQNIPYFKEKADTNSSAGWKNSVRHNLSLHNRFMRVQNETGTGKSSWWMVNMSAKFDKPSRRRAASMETKEYEKRKGRMKKPIRDREVSSPIAGGPAGGGGGGSGDSPSPYLSVTDFRSRASSTASSYGCLSPKSPSLEDHTSPGLSPRSWSTGSTGYDSTGSINGPSGYGFPFESDFSNALAKNVRISAPASFEPASLRLMQPNTAIGNYHPLATNGFYETPRTYFAGQFPSIPEEPRNHHQPSSQQQQYFHPQQPHHNQQPPHQLQQQQPPAPPPTGPAKVVSSTSVLAESGVSGGNFTTFAPQPGYHHHHHPQWSLPQDLESFATEPVQSFDFDWEELLQQEAAIERTMQAGSGVSGRFLNADTK